jgi:hypothetical protein
MDTKGVLKIPDRLLKLLPSIVLRVRRLAVQRSRLIAHWQVINK